MDGKGVGSTVQLGGWDREDVSAHYVCRATTTRRGQIVKSMPAEVGADDMIHVRNNVYIYMCIYIHINKCRCHIFVYICTYGYIYIYICVYKPQIYLSLY